MQQSLPKGHIDKRTEGDSDYERIYTEGIDLLQHLSSEHWTDYNEHDPGVTILENISYALTNLSFKADLPVKDLLKGAKGDPITSGDNGFFIPSEILTTTPITATDYRKLFIDRIKNFKNVYINVKKDVTLGGLYDIYVEMYTYSTNETELKKEKQRIVNEVKQHFHAHRNLCEDLYNVTILEPYYISLSLQVTLKENVEGEETFAKIYYAINDYLSHEVLFSSLVGLQKRNVSTNTIFDGPMLENGFIEEAELQNKKSAISQDQIMKIVGNIEGVISIDSFGLFHVNTEGKKRKLTQEEKLRHVEFPILSNPTIKTNLSFKHEGVIFKPNIDEINNQISYIDMLYRGAFKAISRSVNVGQIPDGTAMEVGTHFPIREQFPLIYGIGEHGLEKRLPKKRYAQANQLKAFLLPFDQLMVNFLEQLDNIYHLYSTGEIVKRSYFTSLLDDMEVLTPLIKTNTSESDSDALAKWSETLTALETSFDQDAMHRLHEIADSLLARFSEKYPTNALKKINQSTFGDHSDHTSFDEKILKWKRKLLKNYNTIAYNRSKGINHVLLDEQSHLKSSDPYRHVELPGLIQKVALLLGIEDYSIRSLSNVVTSSGIKLYLQKEGVDFLTEKIDVTHTRGDIEIIEVEEAVVISDLAEDLKDRFYFLGNSEALFEDILRNGIKGENYHHNTVSSSKDDPQHIYFGSKNGPSQLIHTAGSKEKAKKGVQKIIAALRTINAKSEGLHLVEHLLLAPNYLGDYFGFKFVMQIDDTTQIQFNQKHPTTQEKRAQYLTDIKENNADNCLLSFGIESLKDGFEIQVNQEQKTIAVSESFTTFLEAHKALDRINCTLEPGAVAYDVCDITYWVQYEQGIVDESFFSFNMSLVLPSWPARFQNPNFRTKFNNTLSENAPAHIAFHSFYPKYQEFSHFETIYFKWLTLLPKKGRENERMKYAYELIMTLKEFHEKFCHH